MAWRFGARSEYAIRGGVVCVGLQLESGTTNRMSCCDYLPSARCTLLAIMCIWVQA